MNRDFKGVWIPKEIYLNEELSWTEKILLVEINSLDQGKGCWAGNEYFAEFLGKSESCIANALTKLRKLNFIEDRSFDGRKRYISMKAEFLKLGRQGSCFQEGRVPVFRNEKDENIPYGGLTEPENEGQTDLINTVNNTKNTVSAETVSLKKETRYVELDTDVTYKPKVSQGKEPPEIRSAMLKLIEWATNRRGGNFPSPAKQMKALKILKDSGISPNRIKERWIELEGQSFYQDNGLDFMSLVASFNKKI